MEETNKDAGVKIEELGMDLYNSVLDCITLLMALDPHPDTPDGRLLLDLAEAAEQFELAKFGKDFAPK